MGVNVVKLVLGRPIIAASLDILTAAGKLSVEQMVLWLGRRSGTTVSVEEVFHPLQRTTDRSINIPTDGMSQIYDAIRTSGLMVAAQVHSHPHEAFHSYADDCLSVPRHEGAISIVVPYFGFRTTVNTFEQDSACFRLSRANTWEPASIAEYLEIHQ